MNHLISKKPIDQQKDKPEALLIILFNLLAAIILL